MARSRGSPAHRPRIRIKRSGKNYPERPCEQCGESYQPRSFRQRFCSQKCSQAHSRAQYAAANPTRLTRLPTGTVGAVAELAVSVDLLRRGVPVFRALSPSCPCDLAALVGSRLVRIEVRTGHRRASGDIRYPNGLADSGRQDVWAVYLHETPPAVHYFAPDGSEWDWER